MHFHLGISTYTPHSLLVFADPPIFRIPYIGPSGRFVVTEPGPSMLYSVALYCFELQCIVLYSIALSSWRKQSVSKWQ